MYVNFSMTFSVQRSKSLRVSVFVNPNYVGTLHDGECFAYIILLIKFAGNSWGWGYVSTRMALFNAYLALDSPLYCKCQGHQFAVKIFARRMSYCIRHTDNALA